jgi:hypothetical protein
MNLIFTFNFGGRGASRLDVLLGRGLNVWTVFGRGLKMRKNSGCSLCTAPNHSTGTVLLKVFLRPAIGCGHW